MSAPAPSPEALALLALVPDLVLTATLWLSARMALRRERATAARRAAELERTLASREVLVADLTAARDRLSRREAELDARLSGAHERIADLRERHEGTSATLDQARDLITRLRARIAALEGDRAAATARLAEREHALGELEARMQREFELLAGRLLDHGGQRLADQNREAVAGLLAPVRDQLGDLRRQVTEALRDEGRERASLLGEVRRLQAATERMDREAAGLARALRGDKRLQGAWGETVLERLLEASGLERGRGYELQVAHRDEEGDLRRPDAIVHLPRGRDVVVDAKVTLVAWQRAVAAETPEARQAALRALAGDLRAQVRRLAAQDYDALLPGRALDVVLLFVPVEPALAAALEQAPELVQEALDRRILLVSPATLMLALRIVEQVWRTEDRDRNAQRIAREAGALHDQFVAFLEQLEAVGRHLEAARRSQEDAVARLHAGRGNLVRRADRLRRLGGDARRRLPETGADPEPEDEDGPAPR